MCATLVSSSGETDKEDECFRQADMLKVKIVRSGVFVRLIVGKQRLTMASVVLMYRQCVSTSLAGAKHSPASW